mmetsp:Transcript_16989/g.30323  ORF Transcript_16989/g.30323 Transcript_16989/m.30323 type:complete len:481 (+) Transcript_16989:2-1444(+)
MHRHFSLQSGDCELVSFTRYWKGMEAILHACGVFHDGDLDSPTELKVQSLRAFRDSVLELGEPDVDVYSLAELRQLYERLRDEAAASSTQVHSYWEEKLGMLPSDEDHEDVTADEIANALLTWIEDLLKDYLGDENGFEGASETGSSDQEDMLGEAGLYRKGLGATADFGGRTADFGCSEGLSVANGDLGGAMSRFATPVDVAGGGTFGQGLPLPPPPGRSGHHQWLRAVEPGDRIEVRQFHEQFVRHLPNDGSELLISQLYSALRDTVEAHTEAIGGATPSGATPRRRTARAAIRAGVERLAGVARRYLRGAFRDWEDQAYMLQGSRAGSRPVSGQVGEVNILAELVRSQARAAEILERRYHLVYPTYRLAWILGQAQRRSLSSALARWQPWPPGSAAMPAGSPAAARSPGIASSPGPDSEERPASGSGPLASPGAWSNASSASWHRRRPSGRSPHASSQGSRSPTVPSRAALQVSPSM